jgi:hypothetical protein
MEFDNKYKSSYFLRRKYQNIGLKNYGMLFQLSSYLHIFFTFRNTNFRNRFDGLTFLIFYLFYITSFIWIQSYLLDFT